MCDETRISYLEKEYIKEYDSYYNGYNQNEGGNFGPSNGGSRLTRNDIFNICSALEFCSRPGAILSEIFSITTTTISRIKNKTSHMKIIEEYENKTINERKEMYNLFCKNSDFYNRKVNKSIIKNNRKFTRNDIYMILCNEEFGRIIPMKRLVDIFPHIKSSYTFKVIVDEKSYKDYYLDYKKISKKQKEEIVALLKKLAK